LLLICVYHRAQLFLCQQKKDIFFKFLIFSFLNPL
ncbi:hypothetical protein A5834_002434, partial [Enterococcus faecium]